MARVGASRSSRAPFQKRGTPILRATGFRWGGSCFTRPKQEVNTPVPFRVYLIDIIRTHVVKWITRLAPFSLECPNEHFPLSQMSETTALYGHHPDGGPVLSSLPVR